MSVTELLPETQAPPRPRRFTVEEYLAMAGAGILKENERVQLINGEIVRMGPMGIRHGDVLALLHALLLRAFDPGQAIVRQQSPVVLAPDSMPEPDFAVCDESVLGSGHYPQARDLILVIEVSDSTLKFDTGAKLALYARAGIREYWVVNLRTRSVEVYRQPDPAAEKYRDAFTRKIGEKVSVESHPQVEFEVGNFFGAKK